MQSFVIVYNSHVYNNREGSLVSLIYDDEDRLIFARVNEQNYYVVTDRKGSPNLFFTPTGKVVREIERTVYGDILSDTNNQIIVPVGFAGGIYDHMTQLTHIQVR